MNTFKTIALNFLPKNFFLRIKVILIASFFIGSFVLFFYMHSGLIGQIIIEESISMKRNFENFINERYKSHQEKIFTYASWEEVWNLITAKKEEKTYFAFQQDKSILDRYDFFTIYLNPTKAFIILKNPRTKTEFKLDPKLVSSLFQSVSMKSDITQTIVSIESEFYLISVSALKDDAGKPQIEGIMIFAENLNEIISNFEKNQSVHLQLIPDEDKTGYTKLQFLTLKKIDSELRYLIQSKKTQSRSTEVYFLIFFVSLNVFFNLLIYFAIGKIEKEYNYTKKGIVK